MMTNTRDWPTLLRHLCYPQWRVARVFTPSGLQAIEHAIAASEQTHHGELRFVVEGGLDLLELMRTPDARQRALEVFSQLRVWDTEDNSGVLIYVGLADHRVEIVADRGIDRRVSASTWREICAAMETQFARGNFEAGAIEGVVAIGKILAEHFPAREVNPDELGNAPLLI